MQLFEIKGLQDWDRWQMNEMHTFASNGNGRVVKFEINTNCKVEVYARETSIFGDLSDEVLVAAVDGRAEIKISTRGSLEVRYVTQDENPQVYFKAFARYQAVEPMSEEKFTNLEMGRRRNSDIDRMMMIMQHNEMQRTRQMNAAIAAIKTDLEGKNDVLERTGGDVAEKPFEGGPQAGSDSGSQAAGDEASDAEGSGDVPAGD